MPVPVRNARRGVIGESLHQPWQPGRFCGLLFSRGFEKQQKGRPTRYPGSNKILVVIIDLPVPNCRDVF
jgi:hypothetical protein